MTAPTVAHDLSSTDNAPTRKLLLFDQPSSNASDCCAGVREEKMVPPYHRGRSEGGRPYRGHALRDRALLFMKQRPVETVQLASDMQAQAASSLMVNNEHKQNLFSQRMDERRRTRINGYFWVFARQASHFQWPDARESGAFIAKGQYGGSQIGTILSQPISSKPDPELAVFGRITAALAPLAQEEIAVGVSLRPVRHLPYSVHVEQRFDAETGGDRGTAFYVAGGTGPDHIVDKIELETYGQGGYILGENETYFFDGSVNLLRQVAQSDRKTVSVGAGVWVGGQRNIFRLDAGPRAEFKVPLAESSMRIAVDWRTRLAGAARPSSGLAITLSTGF